MKLGEILDQLNLTESEKKEIISGIVTAMRNRWGYRATIPSYRNSRLQYTIIYTIS